MTDKKITKARKNLALVQFVCSEIFFLFSYTIYLQPHFVRFGEKYQNMDKAGLHIHKQTIYVEGFL